MTTPESFILMLSWETSKKFFSNLKFLIIDEIHTLFNDKKGDLLSLEFPNLEILIVILKNRSICNSL